MVKIKMIGDKIGQYLKIVRKSENVFFIEIQFTFN